MAFTDPPTLVPSSTLSSKVSSETVGKAVDALLKWNESVKKKQKAQLLEQDEFIYLILTLKKIPSKSRLNPFKISLPHQLHTPEEELCLIIDDRPKSQLTSEASKKKIQAEGIPISKVVKLTKLKTDYRPFEAKRKLCNSYDLFFADKRIIPFLPSLLGKLFFKKKKIPIPIDLTHKNWKGQIEQACGSALLYLRTGTCCVLKVARVSQGRDDIVSNVAASIDGVAGIIPKKWANVRSFHLKMNESLALPVYQSIPDMGLKIEGVMKKKKMEGKEEVDAGLVSEKKGKLKDEKKSGKKFPTSKKKGRIHEVRYMDNNNNNLDELVGNEELGSDLDSDDGENNENYELGSAELSGKKRKKVDRMEEEQVLKEWNGEKQKKKQEKVKKWNAEKNELNGEKKQKKPEKVKKGNAEKKKKSRISSESGGEEAALDDGTSGAMTVSEGPKKKSRISSESGGEEAALADGTSGAMTVSEGPKKKKKKSKIEKSEVVGMKSKKSSRKQATE